MYVWVRTTHLLLGAFSSLFVLMYGVSAVRFVHGSWFSREQIVTESRVAIRPENGTDARAVARELMAEHELRGELGQGKTMEAGFRFNISRPGTTYQVEYNRVTGEAKIQERKVRFMMFLTFIHNQGGLWHQYWLMNAWGVFIGLVSMSMMVLGLSGIYLWFKIHNERKIGTVLLLLSLGYSLTVMFLLRIA